MPKLSRRFIVPCAGAVALAALAGPAAGEPYYRWVTKDGVHAFTDDPKAVPTLYKKQAQRARTEDLSGYARYTANDPAASNRYAQRLAARLEYLRRVNSPTLAAAQDGASGAGTAPAISLRTGGDRSPILDVVPTAGDAEPIVVETLRARPADGLVTRNNVVVRQGERTIAIVRSRGREWNVNEDIHVEDDLER